MKNSKHTDVPYRRGYVRGVIIIFAFACTIILSCGKNNRVIPVNGTIDGVVASALYGGSHKLTDYILLSRSADKLISYYGQTYVYRTIPASNQIFIDISLTAVMKGTLDTSGTIITMVIDTSTHHGLFASTNYVSQ